MKIKNISDIKTGNIIKITEPTQKFSYDLYLVLKEAEKGYIELRTDDGNLFDPDNKEINFPLDLLLDSEVSIIDENLESFIKNIS